MPKNSTLLPIILVLTIFLLLMIVVASGRSNAPAVTGNPEYAHRICTFNRYCAGQECTSEPLYIISYAAYDDGEPRLEFDGMTPAATMTRTDDALSFTSSGGTLEGTLTIFRDRDLDFYATSRSEDGEVIEHFASGRCDRLVSP